MSAAEFKEETVGIQGGRTGPAGLPESGPCCAGDTGSEDARGALPAAPTRASSASRCRPPRTRALGGHTKGMERSASPGAVDGRRGWDEVAGPRRSLSPRLCLPRSAPPPLRGAPPPAAPSPCSLPGWVAVSSARRPHLPPWPAGQPATAATVLPRAVRPQPLRPQDSRGNERVSVRPVRTRGECLVREMRSARVHTAAAGLPLAGQRGPGVERGVRTERGAGQGGEGGGSLVEARGRDRSPWRVMPGPAPTGPPPRLSRHAPCQFGTAGLLRASAGPAARPLGVGREGAGRAFVPANRRLSSCVLVYPTH